jgi:hypothetical protein
VLDHRGLIAGAKGANIFLVIEARLHAPIADCYLNGENPDSLLSILSLKTTWISRTSCQRPFFLAPLSALSAGSLAKASAMKSMNARARRGSIRFAAYTK